MSSHESLPRIILDHYEDPFHMGELAGASHRGTAALDSCDNQITIELLVRNGTVEEAWFQASGCKWAQAVASMLVEQVEGEHVDALTDWDVARVFGHHADLVSTPHQACCNVAFEALKVAVDSPLNEEDGPRFSGLNLGDES